MKSPSFLCTTRKNNPRVQKLLTKCSRESIAFHGSLCWSNALETPPTIIHLARGKSKEQCPQRESSDLSTCGAWQRGERTALALRMQLWQWHRVQAGKPSKNVTLPCSSTKWTLIHDMLVSKLNALLLKSATTPMDFKRP